MSTASTDIQTAWQRLSDEVEKWQIAGREVALWWRDDDVIEPTPELARLTGISQRYDIPLSLAVIPANMSETLAHNTDLSAGSWPGPSEPGTCRRKESRIHQSATPGGYDRRPCSRPGLIE